jgi:GAF domain-containing protein
MSEPDLARVLSVVARTLQAERSLEDTLRAIVVSAIDTIPGAEHVGITAVQQKRLVQTVASTDELVGTVDKAQYELGEGPCLDAVWTHATFRVDDLTTDDRWPAFGPAALELGVRSILAFQLYVVGGDLGALNVYSVEPYAFDDEAQHVGQLFATHAAVAMAESRRERQLSEAISSRDLIGQAKGILMQRHRVSGEQAFQILIKASQDSNIKLREVAGFVVEHAESAALERGGGPGVTAVGTPGP